MSIMRSNYKGKLTSEQQLAVRNVALFGPASVRQAAKDLDLPYGQVRGYVEWYQDQHFDMIPPPTSGPKMLVFDIETAPYLIHAWGIWQQNAIDIAAEWFMLCFAYAWYDPETQTIGDIGWVGLPQDPNWEGGGRDDYYVVDRLWRLFDEADIIIGQNHERFDIKKANERFLIHGMNPPSPYKTVDTRKEYNRYFAGSAALKYIARRVDVAQKLSNRGWSLWFDCMAGDPTAWEEMEEYNKGDVQTNVEVYVKLLPWIGALGKPAHPHLGHLLENEPGELVCPNCGNRDREHGGKGFTRRGYYETAAYRYPKYRCNRCKSYRKIFKAELGTRTTLR